jgi:hypothetical protein
LLPFRHILVKHVESRLVSLAQNFDLKGIYVIDDTIVPLHAYEMAAQVIDVVLNDALAVSSDKPRWLLISFVARHLIPVALVSTI